jgi:hypothetical protein
MTFGTKKKWHYKTGDCLIEVNAWTGLTVYGKYIGCLHMC